MVRIALALLLFFIPTQIGFSHFPTFKLFPAAPTQALVGKHYYKIYYVPELHSDRNEPLLGMTDLLKKEIYIKIPDRDMESTIVHEFIHAMAYENGFDMDEQSVLKMESALYRFLSDNYKLTAQ